MGRPEKAKHRKTFLNETSANGLYKTENRDKILNEELEKPEYTKYKKLITSPLTIKGVKNLESKNKQNEHILKGILRAKHNLFVNKDGTSRYDATESSLTHFKPCEIGTTIEKLIELGYTSDYLGKKLTKPTQLLEILPQDVILPDCTNTPDEKASDFIINVGNFIDELLINLYSQKPIYKFKTKEDTIGHLIVSIAPHTSCGIIGRIIGYSKNQTIISSPLFHAAQRRNLDGDECGIMLLSDTLINFSREFLPDRRGAKTMDCPLVLTTNINLDEVDDEVFGVDIESKYPLDLYKKAKEFKNPNEVKITQIKSRLNSNDKYSRYNFTHNVKNINDTIMISSYKTIPTMDEKLEKQLDIQKKIRAVDENKSAELIITRHFIRDIKGNLKSFSNQSFRCTSCNHILRRPTLNSRCPKCFKQSINLTIHEQSIKKYLNSSLKIIKNYKISPYVIETIEDLKLRLSEVFGESEK
jgi:DNA polymerase II large subunit